MASPSLGWPTKKMMPTMTDASPDILRAAIYGHLVGDAIGVPYEFIAPDAHRVVELRGHGSHDQPPGTWSDDGALMLALLDSLRQRRVRSRGPGPPGARLGRCGRLHARWRREVRHRWRHLAPRFIGSAAAPRARGRRHLRARPGQRQPHAILPVALIDVPDDDAELVQRAHPRESRDPRAPELRGRLRAVRARRRATLLEHPGEDPKPRSSLRPIGCEPCTARCRIRCGLGSAAGASVTREQARRRLGARQLLVGMGGVRDFGLLPRNDRALHSIRARHRYDRCHRRGARRHALGDGRVDGRIPREWLHALRGKEIVEGILGSE